MRRVGASDSPLRLPACRRLGSTVLARLLEELEAAQQPLTLQELSARLGVEPSALEGMLQTLMRMGKLRDDRAATMGACALRCANCDRMSECALLARLPRTYSLVRKKS